ncbi:MAG: asparagine--tRNA ligase [Nitrospirae bacterium]|nr:asparagine--tRNA ligase [Nitrospirota bacterium]
MKRLLVKDVISDEYIGKEILVCGWVKTKRVSKDIVFLIINDGSTQDTLQLIIFSNNSVFHNLDHCNTGASIMAKGILKESPGKGQKFEMEVSEIVVFGDADPEKYPLQKKGHTLEFLREIGHLRSRTNTFSAIFRLRNVVSMAIHEFFQERGFIWVHTPIITSNDCEGAGEMFTVTSLDLSILSMNQDSTIDFSQDFFGRQAFLTVSGQLEAEFLAMSFGKVYTFGPAFRAENSNTSRHLSEFWMVEPEMAFADLRDDIKLAEDFLRFLCKVIIEKGEKELLFLENKYKRIVIEELGRISETNFTHISYAEAIKELEKSKEVFEFPIKWGMDLQSEHERYLTEKIAKGPVIITDFPKEIKAFYMRLNDDEKTVAAMDVLVPRVGEIIGGSQREERLNVLEKRMIEMGISTESLQWYLDLRRFGTAPHAGFGMGLERFLQYITGMINIRDVIPCPRAPKNIGF